MHRSRYLGWWLGLKTLTRGSRLLTHDLCCSSSSQSGRGRRWSEALLEQPGQCGQRGARDP